jgi:hypothetical protein
VCRGCGAYTQPRNGKGDAYAYCKRCHPGAIERRWTQELVISAMLKWRERYGRLPSSYDWSRTHARRRGCHALERLATGDWPAPSVVTSLFRKVGGGSRCGATGSRGRTEVARRSAPGRRDDHAIPEAGMPAAPRPCHVRRNATDT